MATAPTCKFPLGCRMKTRDPSGLCHNHRRFSALTWNRSGEMTQPRRLSTTLAMMKQDPGYVKIYEAAQVAMDNVIDVAEMDQGRYVFTNVGDYELPEVQGAQWDRHSGQPMAVLSFHAAPQGDEQTNQQRVDAMAVRDDIRRTGYADKYQVHEVIGEEYDDEAEVIAQLNVGRQFAGTELSIMHPRDHSEYDMRLVVRPKNSDPSEHFDVSFRHTIEVVGESKLLMRGAEAVRMDGRLQARHNEDVVQAVMNMVHTIDKYSVPARSGERIYLPVGWTDRF